MWLARLIKPYYPACFIATASVPLPYLPSLTTGRGVYSGNHWEVERRMALMTGSFPQWNVFILFLYPVLNSPTNSCCIHLAKPVCFKSTEMKREKQVLLCIFGRGQPHFISLNVADVALLGWPVCGLYLWILLWERESRVQDRHGKGIRQMCCCVWVDQAPGFYCCFSREPLGSLNLPVKFWESQRKSATFLCHLAISTLLQAFH